jgi:hypothetical protein
MRRARAAPSSRYRQKQFRLLLDKRGLLLRSEHQVAVTLLLRGERRENPAANTKIGRAHVRALFRAFETQRDAAEISGGHDGRRQILRLIRSRISSYLKHRSRKSRLPNDVHQRTSPNCAVQRYGDGNCTAIICVSLHYAVTTLLSHFAKAVLFGILQTSAPERTRSLPNRHLNLRDKDFRMHSAFNLRWRSCLEKQRERFD